MEGMKQCLVYMLVLNSDFGDGVLGDEGNK